MNSLSEATVDFKSANNPSGVVFGRFMLPDHSEHACKVTSLTTDGAIFLSNEVPLPGLAIVAYVEEVGRIEAVTGAPTHGGFHIQYSMRGPRLERLQQRLQWLKDRDSGSVTEGRRHTRYEPTEKISQITLPDGRIYNCEVLDISVSGAGIKTEVVPAIGTILMLGKMRGRVVRYIEQGVAVEFVKQLDTAQLPPAKGPSQF